MTELIASEMNGVLTFSALNRKTSEVMPFPRIELLLRNEQDIGRFVDKLRSIGATENDFPVTEPISPGVLSVFGLDEGQSFSLLSHDSMNAMRLTPQLVRAGARARLRQASGGLNVEGGSGRFRFTFPSNPDLTASFILITDAWLDTEVINGDPVFAVGSRTIGHLCGSHDTESVTGLREIADTFYRKSLEDPEANGRPLTPQLLTLRAGSLREWDG